MKGKNIFKRVILSSTVVIFIISLLVSTVKYNKSKVSTSVDNAGNRETTIELYDSNGNKYTKKVALNNPIINSDKQFKLEGKSIVLQAAKHLGREYSAQWVQPYDNNNPDNYSSGKVDCTGLIHVTFRQLGIRRVDGVLYRGDYYENNGTNNWLPRSPEDWMSSRYTQSNTYGVRYYFYNEVGTYAVDGGEIKFGKPQYREGSIYNQTLGVRSSTDNNTVYRMDALKINDPITKELRWYKYYDANGDLKDLPMGTIVISYCGHEQSGVYHISNSAHGWICIGNLGTSDPGEAANKLKAMGIIAQDGSQDHYVTKVSNSTYWLIESTGGYHKDSTGKQVKGVRISNSDPNMNSASDNKGVGTVWAYQIGSGEIHNGSFEMTVSKVDRNNPNTKLAGAKYEFQNRNTKPTSIYTDSDVNPADYTKRGNAITTNQNGIATLPVGDPNSTTPNTLKIDTVAKYDKYIYGITERTAPEGYALTGNPGSEDNPPLGFRLCTELKNDTYVVKSVDVYYGLWAEREQYRWKKWGYLFVGEDMWYTTDHTFVKNDPGKEKTIAKFSLKADSNDSSKIHMDTVYYNPVIEGDYNLNIIKKPEGESFDNDSSKKYSTAMANAKFEVKQYLNTDAVDNLSDDILSSIAKSGNNDTVVTEAGTYTEMLFKQRDKNGNVIQEGGQDKYDTSVNIYNVSKPDIYTINETEAPEGTYNDWERGPFTLVVYKKADRDRYEIDKVKLVTGSKSYEISTSATSRTWLRIDKDGNKTENDDDYAIAIDISKQDINITWRNPEDIVGKYNLNVKKVDAKTDKAMQGVTFKVNNVERTTNENGIAAYDDVTIDKDNADTIDSYTIEEVSLGTENQDKYYKLNETISFEVRKELDISSKQYKIAGIRFVGDSTFAKKITKKVKDVSNRDVPIEISINGSTNTIAIRAENNKITPLKFRLNKTNLAGDTSLDETSFKVDKYTVDDYRTMVLNNPTTILNGKLSTKTNGIIDDVNSMDADPKAYVYDIHETTAQDGYLNIFKKKVNGNDVELAYIRAIIKNNENDELTAEAEVIKTDSCTDDEFEAIKSKVGIPVVDEENRTVSLGIKNPNTETTIQIRKIAYSGWMNLPGGIFKVELDGEEVTEPENILNRDGFYYYKFNNLPVGMHSIRIYEVSPPDGYDNVFAQFDGVDGIRVDFKINEDGTSTIQPRTVGGKDYSFTPESINHDEKTTDIEAISKYAYATAAKNISIFISDPTHFDFKMYKKEYTGKADIAKEAIFAGTAKFKIQKVSPTPGDILEGNLPSDTQSKEYTEKNVKINSTYVYEVTEIEVSSEYYKNLVGKKIKITVNVDNNGKVRNDTTRYDIYDGDRLISGNERKDLDTFIKLEVYNNNVVLYVANMKTKDYSVRLVKVDKNGNVYKRSATFDSVMSKTTSEEQKIRENIQTDPNLGYVYLTEGTEIVERGATHTYKITEKKAPAGCILLKGTVQLDILFNQNTTGNIIQNASVKYLDEQGREKLLDGLDVSYNQGGSSTPLVTVYIPNEGTDLGIELEKVDSMGNTIVAANSNDGATFAISRLRVDNNPETPIPDDELEEFTKMINEISAGFTDGGSFNGVLMDGKYTDSIPLGEFLVYRYTISEIKSKTGYANELENKLVIMSIYTNRDEATKKAYVYKVTFNIVDPVTQQNYTEQYGKYIEGTISSDKTKVHIKIENPNGYKIRLNKTDLSGNPIDTALIYANRLDDDNNEKTIVKLNEVDGPNGRVIHTYDSTVTSDYVGISKNEEQVWRIYEKSVGYPYYNVFGTDKYVEVKVKMDNNGDLSVTGYTVKDNQGNEYANLKQYVEQVKFINENNDNILNVTFKNPSGYKLRITKYDGDSFTTQLSGAVVKLDNDTIISGGNSYYENSYVAGISTSKTHTITETSTVANHVNVLAGKSIKLTVKTDAKGNISRSYSIMNGSTIIPSSDSIYSLVIVDDVKIINGEAVIDVKISNPLVGKYNVELYKVDESGNLIKDYMGSNAIFHVMRHNGGMNIVEKDITAHNGVVNVEKDATINSSKDRYEYTITESKAPLGYEIIPSTVSLNTYFTNTGTKLTIDDTRTTLKVDDEVIHKGNGPAQFDGENNVAWYIDTTGNVVTIKLYIKNKEKKFDLALRKYITKVENNQKSEEPNPARKPLLNESSNIEWLKHHTAAYYHTKEAYKVEAGDTVTYRIYVYNEGNVKGYATEITDYLESGLEFIDNEFNRNYGWTATKNDDGTTTVTTTYLKDTRLSEYALVSYLLGTSGDSWRSYVEIQCKVTRPPSSTISYITNRAEITADKAVEINNNEEVEVQLDDIDSQPKNVKQYHDKEMFNYDSKKNYSTDTYYPGYQDDDDKETIYLRKLEYDFELSKTDGENEISGAKFRIEEQMDNGQFEEIYSGPINKNKTIHEPEARGDNSVELFKTYTYRIEETQTIQTKDKKFANLLEGKYIIVKTYMSESGINGVQPKLNKGEYSRGSINSYFGTYGFEIRDKESNTLVTTTDDLGYLYNKIIVDINNDTNPPIIKITIPNERLYSGNYRVNMKKVDLSNNKISEIPFYINEIYTETDTNGEIKISKFSDNADDTGLIQIDKYNVDNVDTYTIEEDNRLYVNPGEGSGDSEYDYNRDPYIDYVLIKDRIKLNVHKSLDTENEKYFVSKVDVEYNVSSHEEIILADADSTSNVTINLATIDDDTVPATITVSPNGTISIIANNKEIAGEYKLRLHKVDENNSPIAGIQFDVTGESGRMETADDGFTRTIENKITKGNWKNVDEYTITEYQDSQGRVDGLKSPIKISITKKNMFKKYVIDNIKLTEVLTGRESIPSSAHTELPGCAVNDDSGRTVTVKALVSDELITVYFENPPIEDIINVKIKKVNSKDNSGINGITFGKRINLSPESQVTTANVNGEDGIAYIDQNRRVSSATSFTYEIRERAIPSTPEGLIFLSDVGWIVKINTKYDEASKHYVIDRNSISVTINRYPGDATYEQRAKQEEIANRIRASLSQDNATLTLNIENEQTTQYGLSIRKADMDTNEEISDAKFTIKEDGRFIAQNQTIAEFANRLANRTGIYVNTTHKYEIYEVAPANEYQNILERTYIELIVTIANDGTATANYTIKAQPNGSSEDVQSVTNKIQEYVNAHQEITSFLEKDGNNFKLNIPNPKDTVPVSLDLIKFETGNIDNRVNNARFSVRRTTFENASAATVDAAVSRFDNNSSVEDLTSILTKAYAINWIDREFVATFGKVYYYEVTETDVPTNYKKEFHSAIIKMYLEKVDGNNVVRSSIVKIKETETSEWTDYNEASIADKLSLEVSGTSVHVKWANELSYNFRLWKKSYNSAIPEGGPSAITDPASGAEFKIVSSNNNTTLVDGIIHQTEMYNEENVHSNTTYTYVLNEKNPPQNHYNLFKDMDIVVTVRVGQNGKLSASNSSINVRASAGKTVSEEALTQARSNVELIVNTADNVVDVYIANKQIHNSYDIQIMKVSDKMVEDPVTHERKYKGVEGIKFYLMGNQLETIGSGYTGPDGLLTIAGIEPNDFSNNYAIAEDRTSAIAAGVTPLNHWISLSVDMTGITPAMSEEEIEEYLNELNPDGTPKRFALTMSTQDEAIGATVHVEGRTIIIMIKNRTKDIEFNLSKIDDSHTRITGSNINGEYVPGTDFRIVNYKSNPPQVLWDGELGIQGIPGNVPGGYTQNFHAQPNSWYEYTVREKATKEGYINVLQGYDVLVHLETDNEGAVIDPSVDSSSTYIRIQPNGLEEPRYTVDEILANNWANLLVSYDTEIDEDTGEEIVSVSNVTLQVINPYEYKLQLNKKDKDGSTPLNVATVTAENIVGADISKIYNEGSLDERNFVLTQIAHATESGRVHVNGDIVTLDKEPTMTSGEYLVDLQGRYAKYDEKQTWRITETDVEAPYKNMLKDKYVIINTYYDGSLQIARHTDVTLNESVNFYVIDKDGNDLTSEYIDYIEVSAEQIGPQWIANVTIKDPAIVKVGLFKQVDSYLGEPLVGANLRLNFGGQTAEISNGSYRTEWLESEIINNGSILAEITELSTPKGYINILEDKVLRYPIAFVNGKFELGAPFIMQRGNYVVGEEFDYIMSHVKVIKSVNDEGITEFMIYVENPTSFKFDLTKLDIDQNNLDGTEIRVESSHSGVHILDGDSNLSFIENDVTEHEIIQYKITEIHTKDGAYVNKFRYPIYITATTDGGQVRILEKKHQVLLPNGSAPLYPFDELEYFDIYIDPADKNSLTDGEMQTITVKMENPPQIKVELIKTTAGRNQRVLPNTKFTIVSQDSHTEYTDNNGKINYIEEIHEPGDYTIRVYEDEVPSPKYVNILENKYMQFNINVTADGTVTVDSDNIKFFKKDNDNYYDNDVEITGDEASMLLEYCSAWAEASDEIDKVMVGISDPVRYDLCVKKETTDGSVLEGAEFEIVSPNGLFDTIHTTTNEFGVISKRIEIARPGVHQFRITEIKPAGNQYDNILDGYVAVVNVRVKENGEISLIKKETGEEFEDDVSNSQKYSIETIDGASADQEAEAKIRQFVSIEESHLANEPDGFTITVVNPIQTKLDIVKRQLNSENQEEDLPDTRFTVIKNGDIPLLSNEIVNEAVEIEEHDLKQSNDYYDIYENRTNLDGAYVNILSGKFIRVYTSLMGNGHLKITDEEGGVGDKFVIYETHHFGPPTKIERDGNEKLYDSIDVWVSENAEGINVLNVKVVNPITIEVGAIKKQHGDGAQPIPDVSISITSDNTGDHDITSTRREEVFSEGNIKPGTYNFIIRENSNPNPRYVNVLKDRYAKANVTVSKTGDITLNNIKYYTNSNVEIVDPEIRSILEETVYATIDKSNRIQKITFVIENPITLKFVVHKQDLANGGLEDATFNVIKYVGDSNEVAKGMTSVDTDGNGVITFEDGDYMKAGIYRYEITELKPAAEKYVNILDCYDDGSQYKVVMYLKLNLNGTTEYVRDAQGTPFANAGRTPYTIVNRNNENAEIPEEVVETVHKYLVIDKTESRGSNPDIFDVKVTNTPQIDIDVIKVTKDTDTNQEKPLSGTKFSAEADDGKGLFEDIPATQEKEYTYKNITAGRHEFYLTESEGVVNGGYINVLEDRYVRVYTTVSADGVMKITDNQGNEDPDYFEIYEGQYNNRNRSALLDRTDYAKIYECVSVESVRQSNGVYKLNLKVKNPERNYNIKLNKKVFGEEDINMKGIEFVIRSTFDGQIHQLTTDEDGNISFEQKRVPVGIYDYYATETKTSGPEFVNVLDDNWILVRLKVNQDGSIEIVDANGESEGNENKYYITDAQNSRIIEENDTIVDDFVRVATDNTGDEPELDFFIKDPERFNFKLVKRDVLTNEKMNNVTFTTNVFYQESGASSDPSEADKVTLVNAETFEDIDISTIKTANIDGVDGVIVVPDILVDKTGTYTFVFHEESTDGLFKYLYKSHAEDITIKVNITVETDNEGRPIGYKVGQPNIVTGAKYVDDESTLTTQTKAQLVRAEVLNTPIRGHYDLVLSKLDKYTSRKLDGAEFDIRAEKDGAPYELYEDVEDLRIENAIIPDHFTVHNGELKIENIRITPPPYQAPAEDGTLETFNIILTETKAPAGYMLLDEPIVLEVTTAIDGEYDDAEYVVRSVNLVSGENYGLVTKTFGKNEINVVAKNEYFDLALRKSIVSVAYSDSDEAKITEAETEDRIPVIREDDEIYDLNPSVTTANYRHVKNHVRVYPGQEVIYCLRVYNEGEIDGYAEEITDHLPEGLEFLAQDKFNTDRGWTLDLTDQSLKTVKTTFLSKNNNPNNDRFNAENNLIKAMDVNVATGVNHNLDYKEIEIKCRVSDNLRPGVILTNIAEISDYKAEGRTQETVDRDSDKDNADIPDGKDLQNYKEDELTDDRDDYVPGQEDDDDFEKLIVVEFDLALRKYITAINDEEVLADKNEAKYTDEVIEDTEDILGEGTASGDAEGTNEGANTNIVDESEGENGNTEDGDAQSGENPGDINTDEESGEEDIDDDNKIKYDREPRVNVSTLKSGDLDSIYKDPEEPTTALYKHTKDPVEVSVDDIVTYTLEVFNEGTVDGYASLIKDDIPEGVEFVPYKEGDGSVNDKYRWKMVDENDEEVTDPHDAKYIVSDYLSKDNETEENGNIIRAFDPATGTRLDSRYVQVQFRVICKQDYPKLITNYAQISDDSDDSGKSVRDRDSHTNEWIDGEDDQDIERIWVTYMDLALRKFITGVTDFKTGETQVVDTRIPQVDPTALINETGTTAKYEHTKEPVLVHTNDVVIYTLRIYNEGSKDGYATQIKDDLPEGLEYLPDHEINKYYEWSLVDKNDKPVTRLEDAEYAVTNYLSKDNETEERQNLIKSFDYYDYENDKPAKRKTPEYKDIKIAFKVTEPQTSDRILINEAQISEQTDGKGIHREDRDSTPNIWLGEDDEDIEKVRVLYFDLALRKWVTKAIVTQNGEEKVFETGHHAEDDPEEVVKVDLKKSKLNKVVVKFEYQIRITNEGEIDGYAKEIKDRIPEGLRFDPADNPTWTQLEENIIVTDQLKDTLLKPGESAEVTVVLTWINSGDNLGLKVNVAEISKDYNDYGTHDIDSTPDNNVWGEDDIDDAPVMLAVKTGSQVFGYVALAVFVGTIIVLGARRIKKINEG